MLMQELVTLQMEQAMQVVSKTVVLDNGKHVEHMGISLHLHFSPNTCLKLHAYSYLHSILTYYQFLGILMVTDINQTYIRSSYSSYIQKESKYKHYIHNRPIKYQKLTTTYMYHTSSMALY
jgi:hypothetical protein